MTSDPHPAALGRLVGRWTTEATHPAMPGVVVRGTVDVEWLEGERFLLLRSRTDHPDFPDALSVIGRMGHDRAAPGGAAPADDDAAALRLHYYDSRGVFRVYETSVDDVAWRWWRNAPGFSQRITGRFADGGDTIEGTSEVCEDDVHWQDDLRITYRRRR
ncbi:hypothetical protein [Roseisolibacter sp. H3M3-2]|uniref:hypothetical protein n=1 Tax=Roseisolibacter sp. H3M3-2 TaxID=3031323 RepID=UPI0023DB22C0|nr:hypothetical protein [Roseisolibacter sp. H3M3-2]MDF1504651.1 hypothetical protein [Roseisolibacter sp. H3M3-2]